MNGLRNVLTPDGGDMARLAGRRVLVTGGAGFIGSHVVRALQERDAEVAIADRVDPLQTDTSSVVRDLSEPGAVDEALAPGTDAVVHLAALTSVLRSVERPQETYDTNVAVTAALLERARQVGVGTFLLASTNAVVGKSVGDGPINEFSPMRPLTPYGATKAAGEMLLSAYSSAFGLRSVAFRLTNVYGPGMSHKDSVVARLMRCACSGRPFDIYGDGRQVRDYVFVHDAVDAMMLGLTHEISGPVVIGSAVSTSVLELVELVQDVSGSTFDARHVPPKPGEMSGVVVDNGQARSWGWCPTVGLRDGLSRVWEAWSGRDRVSTGSRQDRRAEETDR